MATNKQSKKATETSSITDYTLCGYPVNNINSYDEKYICPYCSLIIKEPIQFTECGHRACRGCFEQRAATADETMVCPVGDCETKFHKDQIMPDRAFKRELDKLQVVCAHKDDDSKCVWKGFLKDYQEHLDQNHIRFRCTMCSSEFPTEKALVEHQATLCNGRFEKCGLGPTCTENLIPSDEYEAHLLKGDHQGLIALFMSGKYDIFDTPGEDQAMDSTSADEEFEQHMSEKLADLADKVQTLNDKTVTLSREFVKLNEIYQAATQEINHFQTAAVDRSSAMAGLQPKQESIQKDIDQIKQNIEETQHVSTDGTLTWRVDRVAERMADAQSERQPSIYSPIFYSSPTGYKMRARLYLHGDGNARRTHMSLFFLLMKGEHDALLQWPFGYKVTFCLFDQTGNNRHIIDSFRPDMKSNSFQRPKNDANIASGIPKFFPLPMIQQDDNPYVRDDTMFIKILVDLTDLPKMILPYMLTLNPGLPNHVQQLLINQEKIKRQQNNGNTLATTQSVPMTN